MRQFQKVVVLLISAYQKTLSPDHGWFSGRFPHGFCRFYPSCSEYTRLSILKFGVVVGLYYGSKRIIRCNPFAHPQIDKIPNA